MCAVRQRSGGTELVASMASGAPQQLQQVGDTTALVMQRHYLAPAERAIRACALDRERLGGGPRRQPRSPRSRSAAMRCGDKRTLCAAGAPITVV